MKKQVGPVRGRRGWLERQAFKLAQDCPARHNNPKECPLFGLRPWPARERKAWIGGLRDDELEYLAEYHACCYTVQRARPAG